MFEINEQTKQLTITTGTDHEFVSRVLDEAESFCNKNEIIHLQKPKIILRELLINAVEHGNCNLKNKAIATTITIKGKDLLEISVEDQGLGIDLDHISKEIPEDPLQLRQRGFPLIYANAMDVSFSNDNRKVTITVSTKDKTTYNISKEAEWCVITPTGDITSDTAEELRRALVELIEAGMTYFIFDFTKVNEIDSITLSTLVSFANLTGAYETKNKRQIRNANLDCQRLFRMTHLTRLYDLTENRGE